MSHTKSAGSSCRSIRSRNAIFGWMQLTTDRRAELVAVLERHADGPAAAHQDLRHLRVGADLRAERLGGAADRVGHRAHAALLEAPGAEVPVADVADRVVQHHVRGAGLVRSGPGADHAVHGEHAP